MFDERENISIPLVPLSQKNEFLSKKFYKKLNSFRNNKLNVNILWQAQNFETRIAEHNDLSHNSEPATHLKHFPSHAFSWKVLFPAHGYVKWKIV